MFTILMLQKKERRKQALMDSEETKRYGKRDRDDRTNERTRFEFKLCKLIL